MKILVYSMNFAPELAGIGKYSGEMAEWLHARGHEVRVIASPPFFPQWSVLEGYSAWAYRKTDWNGVTVCRAPTWVPFEASCAGAHRAPAVVHAVEHSAAAGAIALEA